MQDPLNDVSAFVAVLAALLLDNVVTLDDTVNRVTDLVMSGGRPDRDLIVALQGFDRLKQEFQALAGALSRCAEADASLDDGGWEQLAREVIGAIAVADLKRRLLRRLNLAPPIIGAPPLDDMPVDEIDVDVEF